MYRNNPIHHRECPISSSVVCVGVQYLWMREEPKSGGGIVRVLGDAVENFFC